MSAAYIIFNGVSSADKGFLIEQLPDEIKPARRTEAFTPSGRNGTEHFDRRVFASAKTQIKVNPDGHTVHEVYAWLDGEGWLTTSDSPDVMRWVCFYDETKDDRFRIGSACYDTITIPVEVQPFAYLTGTAAADIVLTQPGVFDGAGSVYSEPLIAVQGSGDIDLMVNGASVLIDDLNGTIYIDTEAHVAYTEVGGVKNIYMQPVSLTDGWPTLKPGTNSVNWSGSVTRVTISPRWRRL